MSTKREKALKLKKLVEETNRAACMSSMLEFLDAAAGLADAVLVDEPAAHAPTTDPPPHFVEGMNLLGRVLLDSYPNDFPIDGTKIDTFDSLFEAVEARGDSAGDSLFPFILDEIDAAGREDNPSVSIAGFDPVAIMGVLRTIRNDVDEVLCGVETHFKSIGIPTTHINRL